MTSEDLFARLLLLLFQESHISEAQVEISKSASERSCLDVALSAADLCTFLLLNCAQVSGTLTLSIQILFYFVNLYLMQPYVLSTLLIPA
jgi:hypothetical protein